MNNLKIELKQICNWIIERSEADFLETDCGEIWQNHNSKTCYSFVDETY